MLIKQGRKKTIARQARWLLVGCVLVLLALLILNVREYARTVLAQSSCAPKDQRYHVVGGDTLSGIATRYGTTWTALASYNHLANPSLIMPGQTICIPSGSTTMTGKSPLPASGAIGYTNLFPYGQCTWWANERYAQLHDQMYVPWTSNSNAWQWSDRARDFGWQVSSTPSVGSIIDLQPGVQGASGLGHVAVVEQVLGNGHVIASNMNWGAFYWKVTNVEFIPGPGVTFIHQ